MLLGHFYAMLLPSPELEMSCHLKLQKYKFIISLNLLVLRKYGYLFYPIFGGHWGKH